jgi:ABC-type polysaccharide/polyol phosphate transport system ATPase subunit
MSEGRQQPIAPPVVEADRVAKAFDVPPAGERTIRQWALQLLRPQRDERLRVLEDVSFTVEQGEALGIMGRNGSGKSTLLRILCGIYGPDDGRMVVRAPVTPILELGIGWNTELDAIDNILLVGTVMGLKLRDVEAAVPTILDFAGLTHFARLPLKHYSSGMAARLAYAVAFTAVQGVLVLDEIFAVGDAEFRARCQDRFRALRREGQTVVLVSHDPRTIAEFCDRALLLEQGRILKAGQPSAVVEAYLALLSGGPVAARETAV